MVTTPRSISLRGAPQLRHASEGRGSSIQLLPQYESVLGNTRSGARTRQPRKVTGRAPITVTVRVLRSADSSFADYFDKHPFLATTVKFAIEDLLPGTEVELAFRDCDDHLAPHHLPFQVSVTIVLAGQIVTVALQRLVRSQLLEPFLVIVMESRFVVVNKDRSGDMHCIHERHALAYAALLETFFDFRRDVDERSSRGDVEPQLLAVALH